MDPRDVACTTKVQYPSRAQAKKALKTMRRQGHTALVIYQCWHCELFHLGNPPGRQTYQRKGGIYS